MKNVVFLLSGLLFSFVCLAQDFRVPEDLPTTKEEFISSEKDLIAAAKWLEATPVKNSNERKKVNAWVTAWIINSPTVTVEVRESIIKPFDKNPSSYRYTWPATPGTRSKTITAKTKCNVTWPA